MSLTKEEILQQILTDRERRAAVREQFSALGFSSISLNFNIQGYPKSNRLITNAFHLTKTALKDYLVALRIEMFSEQEREWISPCGDFFIQAVAYSENDVVIKEYLEEFEKKHPLHRLLDVDLFVPKKGFISSGKKKQCFLCENTAITCMKEQRHTTEAYHNYTQTAIAHFLENHKKEKIVDIIATKALKATLLEVSLEKKPGLICPSGKGAHADMDYVTFLFSSSALATHWRKMAMYGYECGKSSQPNYVTWRTRLRMLGLDAERTMFANTNGVNTQKGIIFLLGLGCFAAGVVGAKNGGFCTELFQTTVRELMQGVVTEDFHEGKAKYGTHGELCYQNYGRKLAGGARLEAELGFPTVFSLGLDYLKNQIGEKCNGFTQEDWQKVLLDLLLLIVSRNSDTNILYRKNKETLKVLQCKTARVLKINIQQEKEEALAELNRYCISQNISPGGSADLLALTVFVYFMQGDCSEETKI